MSWMYKRAVWWWLRTNATIWDHIRTKHSKEEVKKATQSKKKGKAIASGEISTEILRALDDQNIDVITNLCNIIYNSGVIPSDLKQSIFITLPKKSKVQSCTENRTISLMSHLTKLLI